MEEIKISPGLEEFDAVATSVQAHLSCSNCLISVLDSKTLYALGVTGGKGAPGNRGVLVSDTICQHTVAIKRPVRISDVAQTPWLRNVPTVKSFRIGAYLGVPLKLASGKTVGAMCAIADSARDWTDGETSYLSELAGLAANKIDLRLRQLEEPGRDKAQDEADRIIGALAQFKTSAISVHDTDGELLFANRGMTETLGLSASDLLHLPLDQLRRVTEDRPTGGMQVRVDLPDRQPRWLAVEWSQTLGGLTLCDWTSGPSEEADA